MNLIDLRAALRGGITHFAVNQHVPDLPRDLDDCKVLKISGRPDRGCDSTYLFEIGQKFPVYSVLSDALDGFTNAGVIVIQSAYGSTMKSARSDGRTKANQRV